MTSPEDVTTSHVHTMSVLSLFDELLLDFDIELKHSLAIRFYAASSPEEKDAIKEGSETIRKSFRFLDDALLRNFRVQGQANRQCELENCKPAIACLVRYFGLTLKRDPRAMIRSSTYRITRREPNITPSRARKTEPPKAP